MGTSSLQKNRPICRPAHQRTCSTRYITAWCILATLLTLFALAGCGGSSSTSTPTASPTSLVIVRTVPVSVQGPPQDFPQLNTTITDSRAVQAFYQQTLALPHLPSNSGPNNGCHDDGGVKYFLIFSGGGGVGNAVDLYAKLTTGTCPTLELTNVDAHVSLDGRQSDQAYLDALAGLLGISPTHVWPIPGANPSPSTTSTP